MILKKDKKNFGGGKKSEEEKMSLWIEKIYNRLYLLLSIVKLIFLAIL
jgi:hypothetical protein